MLPSPRRGPRSWGLGWGVSGRSLLPSQTPRSSPRLADKDCGLLPALTRVPAPCSWLALCTLYLRSGPRVVSLRKPLAALPLPPLP